VVEFVETVVAGWRGARAPARRGAERCAARETVTNVYALMQYRKVNSGGRRVSVMPGNRC